MMPFIPLAMTMLALRPTPAGAIAGSPGGRKVQLVVSARRAPRLWDRSPVRSR